MRAMIHDLSRALFLIERRGAQFIEYLTPRPHRYAINAAGDVQPLHPNIARALLRRSLNPSPK